MDGEAVVNFIISGPDLHAPEAGAVVKDEIVTLAVSPRLGDGKALSDGAAHEGEFAFFAAALWRTGMADVSWRTALARRERSMNGRFLYLFIRNFHDEVPL